MNNSQTKQLTQLSFQSPISNIQVIDKVLYFTVDRGEKGKQRWKIDGNKRFFVAHI